MFGSYAAYGRSTNPLDIIKAFEEIEKGSPDAQAPAKPLRPPTPRDAKPAPKPR